MSLTCPAPEDILIDPAVLETRVPDSQLAVHSLPPELLIDVFFLARDGAGQGQRGRTVWTISQVCHYWRAVSLFEHNLWRVIDFLNQGWVKEFLRRSLPHRVSASLRSPFIEDFRPVLDELSNLEFISLFRTPNRESRTNSFKKPNPLSQAAPFLRHLFLADVSVDTNFLGNDAPLLQQLILDECSLFIGYLHFNWPSLVSLAIINPSDFASLALLIDVMKHMPSLEELKLVGLLASNEEFDSERYHTPFPRLRRLHLSSIALFGVLAFLDTVSLSPPTSFKIEAEECFIPLITLTAALHRCLDDEIWRLQSLQMSVTTISASLTFAKYVLEEGTSSTRINFEAFDDTKLNISELDQIVSSFDLSHLTSLDLSGSSCIDPEGIWLNEFHSLPRLQSLAVRGCYCTSFIKHLIRPVDQVSMILRRSSADGSKYPDRDRLYPLICFPTLRHLTFQRLRRQNKLCAQTAPWPVPFPMLALMLGVRMIVGSGLEELVIIGYEFEKEEKELQRLKKFVAHVDCYPQKRALDDARQVIAGVSDSNGC